MTLKCITRHITRQNNLPPHRIIVLKLYCVHFPLVMGNMYYPANGEAVWCGCKPETLVLNPRLSPHVFHVMLSLVRNVAQLVLITNVRRGSRHFFAGNA